MQILKLKSIITYSQCVKFLYESLADIKLCVGDTESNYHGHRSDGYVIFGPDTRFFNCLLWTVHSVHLIVWRTAKTFSIDYGYDF